MIRPMFERFTERARQVVVLAQEEARGLSHNYIGTEHLLLGVLRLDGGVAIEVLSRFGLSAEAAREDVKRIVGLGVEGTPGQIPFTPRAKSALELSLRESAALGDKHIDAEHILLALARVRDGVAARILVDAGVDAASLRNLVVSLAWGGAGERERPMTPEYREVLKERLALVEAQLLAFEHRADIVDAVADAPSRPDAETVIATRLKLTLRQAQAVLAVRLGQWTSDEVEAIRRELADLQARLASEDAAG